MVAVVHWYQINRSADGRSEQITDVLSIHQFSSGVLADIIRRQPSSPARTAFAWQLAVGPVLAKATAVELVDGVLTVRSTDARWTLEINRARGLVLARLQNLLGRDAVTSLTIEPGLNPRQRQTRP